MKTFEILFSEVCNLYGDRGNITFLKNCFPEESFVFTSLLEEPYFVHHDVDLIYLGPMSETVQEKVMIKLLPYKKRIQELIEKGVVFLFTGNAMEMLGSEIETEDGMHISGLNIFSMTTKRHPNKRYNSLILGKYHRIKIVGYVSQSSTSMIHEPPFLTIIRDKKGSTQEGIHVKNFFGTNLLGPILILNPKFASSLLKVLGYEGNLPYQEALEEAYQKRLKEYEKPNIQY